MFNNNSQDIYLINKKGDENKDIPYLKELKYLMEYIICQNNINKQYKISLFKIRGFDPLAIFKEIDSISSDLINQSDLEEYLLNNNVKEEKDIILLFIKEFNKQENDNNLSAQDFIKFINFGVDKDEFHLGELNYDKNEITKKFLNLLISEFKLIKERNELINNIKKIKEFSTYGAFDIISNGKKYIDYDCFKLFLGNKYNKKEIKDLIYRLDLNDDNKISYDEFQDIFFPFQKHLNIFEKVKNESIDSYNDNENKYDVLINDIYSFNLNPYKDENLIQPKTANNYEINNDIYDNNSKYYDDNIFTVKYDENLVNEINKRLEGYNNNDSNNIGNLDKLNNINIKESLIMDMFIEDEFELDKNDEDKKNTDNLNINEQNNNSKSDILKSNIDSEQNTIKYNTINFIDMLTEKDKLLIKSFIDYIHSVALLEIKAENLRESISLCNDISLLNIFHNFDVSKQNSISKLDFRGVCNKEYLLFPSESQINFIYNRYDLDNDESLNLEEFMNMISPFKKEYQSLISIKKESDYNNTYISFSSKKKVIELLRTIIDNEKCIHELKNKLNSNKVFNFFNLWGILIKYSQDNQILNKSQFNNFLESFKCYLTQYELDLVFCKIANNKEMKYNDLFKEIIN